MALIIIECLVKHFYWNRMSDEGIAAPSIIILMNGVVLANEFLYLALIYFISSGIMLLAGIFSVKDLVLIALFLAFYAVYAILYLLYGSVVQFLFAIIYLVMMIYTCRITSFTASKIASVMHDLQQSPHSSRSQLDIPQRKLQAVFLVRKCTIGLLVLLAAGSLMASILFSSYFWVAEIYNKNIKLIYLFILLYIFRCTSFNVVLYEPMPCTQSDIQALEELNLRELSTNTLSTEIFSLDNWCLVFVPGENFYIGRKGKN
eukprot:TRINITY_DN7446_c0_g1_i6.p1 TRINITY_DN7446_c0_g1~~TRINITY_DN7446_c0_g1_i6.p1  ORF type:complete len:260 (-),score=42.47 TRINITY_DN7446_c0_g1_i6:164-943(-)